MKSRAILTVVLICLAVQVVLGQATDPAAPDPPATREDILKLLDAMQARTQMHTVMNQIMLQMRSMNRQQMKKLNPNVSEEELAKMDARADQLIKDMPIDGIIDDMVPIYQKHLTKSDVDTMIGFYSTPTGQKLLRELPVMTSESMQAVQPRLLKQMNEAMQKAQELTKQDAAKQLPAATQKQ
jgi:hypothetical protein